MGIAAAHWDPMRDLDTPLFPEAIHSEICHEIRKGTVLHRLRPKAQDLLAFGGCLVPSPDPGALQPTHFPPLCSTPFLASTATSPNPVT